MDIHMTEDKKTEAISKDQYVEKRIEALEKEVESLKHMMQIQTEINDSQHKINEHARSCIQALLKQKEKSDS